MNDNKINLYIFIYLFIYLAAVFFSASFICEKGFELFSSLVGLKARDILPAALIASTVALSFCLAVKFFLIFSATNNFLLKLSVTSVDIQGCSNASLADILLRGSIVNNLLIKSLALSEISSHSGEKYLKIQLTTELYIS